MATRGVWQLQKLTIRYCQYGGSSRYVRELLKHPSFFDFVRENSHVEFHTEVKANKHPILVGDYITNERKVCDVKNQDIPFLMKQIQRLRDTSGRKMTKINAPIISKRPTIQGIWQPDTEQILERIRFDVEHHMK
jgi:large subunit ribosomal protein L43